jgi:hypothetical protein
VLPGLSLLEFVLKLPALGKEKYNNGNTRGIQQSLEKGGLVAIHHVKTIFHKLKFRSKIANKA